MIGWFGRSSARSGGSRLRLRSAVVVIALVVLAAFMILVSAGCADLAEKGAETGSSTTASGVTTTSSAAGSIDGAPADAQVSPAVAVAEAVGPSVVNVGVTGSVPGVFGTQDYSAEGSGVIFSSDGMIVTNNHVVSQESGGREFLADTITITLETGEKLPATVVGTDPITDLAVLKVDKTGLPAATFIDDFSKVSIGEYAIAIGSPLGLENSVTLGIISGVQRELEVAPGVQQFSLVDLVQTDAAISPGNSGGALVDVQGRVIGINVAYLPPGQTGAQNVGFAIPADLVVDVADELIATGDVQHAYLGIQTVSVSDVGAEFNLDVETGALVYQVFPGTPAEQAGLERGDVIVEADGTGIDNDSDLFSLLRRRDPGDEIGFTLIREGEEQTIEVTLGARPEDFGR